MRAPANVSKGLILVAAVVITGLLTAGEAAAQSCVNDDDCTADPACGGPVCDWTKSLTCQPAGGAAKGTDGWCTVDDDCKCKGLGAVCVAPYCTFTLPSQAPGAGATGGASGGTGGAPGTDAGTKPKDDGGGCAIARGTPASALGALVALAAVATARRRRRRV